MSLTEAPRPAPASEPTLDDVVRGLATSSTDLKAASLRLAASSQRFTPVEALPWSHRVLPRWLRTCLTDFGLWEPPAPQPASRHLTQVGACLTYYGWSQGQDCSARGKLCIRGAQAMLERAGYVTPEERELAVSYMQRALQNAGISMTFYTWNDLPGQTVEEAQQLLTYASAVAAKEGN